MHLIKWIIGIPIMLVIVAFSHYTLPSRDIVEIVGTEVKRMELGPNPWFYASQDSGTNKTDMRDVRFINAAWPDGKPSVYRNEDTNWNWPPYFKFNAGDISAQAQSLAKQEKAWVAVTHYGWRSNIFSIFPNIISMEVVEGPDVSLFPWFNIIFILFLLGLALIAFFIARAFKRRQIDPVLADIDEAIDGVEEDAGRVTDRIRKFFKRFI